MNSTAIVEEVAGLVATAFAQNVEEDKDFTTRLNMADRTITVKRVK